MKEITTDDNTLFVSYSRYSNFEKCPFKYKKMYIDKIETFQDNEFSIFGTAMHSTIQDFVEKKYNKLLKENQINLNNMKLTKEIHSIVEEKKILDKNILSQLEDFNFNGIKILKDVYKKRETYFPKHWKLVGNEIKLKIKLKNNIVLTGYIDSAFEDVKTGEHILYDYKTSLWGWKKNKKDDVLTRFQLILYKIFYSALFDVPLEKIKVMFVILKQNIWEKADFPQTRITKFEVPSGKVTINKCLNSFEKFLEHIRDEDFEYKKTTNKKDCAYCPFIEMGLCGGPDKKKK